jgi:DNA polymerase (family 10)
MSQGTIMTRDGAIAKTTPLMNSIALHPGVVTAQYAGSIRRERFDVNDVDITASLSDVVTVAKIWEDIALMSQLEYSRSGEFERTTHIGDLKVEIRFFRPCELGAALLFSTGSHKFNVALRGLAKKKNMLLNRYGLWTREANQADRTLLAARTEGEIFQALGMKWIEPKYREDATSEIWEQFRRG